MIRRWNAVLSIGLCLNIWGFATADELAGVSTSELIPLTRDDMKRALDASKYANPRLPLPPVTAEETAFIEQQKATAAKTGENPRRLGLANNGRMRAYYLTEYGFSLAKDLERASAGTTRDAESSLDPAFRTMLFWIVSRGNNCTYCLGHQESGLANRGLSDDELAMLDGDWSTLDEARKAAFTFTKKLSFEPYLIDDYDLVALGKHYNPTQVAEMILAVAGFNATNRWTGPLRIRQDVLFQFERPTSPSFVSALSRLAPFSQSATGQGLVLPMPRPRRSLETLSQVQSSLDAARKRTPRLKLADASATKLLLNGATSDVSGFQWAQLLASLPKTGADRIATYTAVFEKGTLDLRTKAIIAYVGARQDRAWYALGHAIQRLKSLGLSEEQIFALDQPEKLASQTDREVVEFARKITVDPALIDDDDFRRMGKHFNDKQVAEVVYQTTQAAFFDRLTEAAGLRLEN